MAIDHVLIQERLARARAGDVEAYGDLVEHLQGVLRGFVAMCGAADGDVEGLAQDAFVEGFNALKTYDPGRPFLAWLRGIARNLVMRSLEHRTLLRRMHDQRLRTHLCQLAGAPPAVEDADADARFDRMHLLACLSQLPKGTRTLLEDRYRHDLDADRIAARDRRGAVAVRVALSRARATLRACIERRVRAEGIMP
jgi:RNA polymerase sigma-70 factor (ECF subfamily)